MADLSDPNFWIPTIISLVAVVLFYINMRIREKGDRKASKLMFELIKTMRQELDLIKEQGGFRNMTAQQALLQKKDELQWKKLIDSFKMLKWLSKFADSE